MRYLLSLFRSWFAKRVIAARCGHRTRVYGRVSAFGHSTITRTRKNDDGTVNFCLKCLAKMAIQCSCGNAIFIGDPVALYSKMGQVPAVIIGDHEDAFVGCMACSDSAANHSGIWIPDEAGKVHVRRIPNQYELSLARPDC